MTLLQIRVNLCPQLLFFLLGDPLSYSSCPCPLSRFSVPPLCLYPVLYLFLLFSAFVLFALFSVLVLSPLSLPSVLVFCSLSSLLVSVFVFFFSCLVLCPLSWPSGLVLCSLSSFLVLSSDFVFFFGFTLCPCPLSLPYGLLFWSLSSLLLLSFVLRFCPCPLSLSSVLVSSSLFSLLVLCVGPSRCWLFVIFQTSEVHVLFFVWITYHMPVDLHCSSGLALYVFVLGCSLLPCRRLPALSIPTQASGWRAVCISVQL